MSGIIGSNSAVLVGLLDCDRSNEIGDGVSMKSTVLADTALLCLRGEGVVNWLLKVDVVGGSGGGGGGGVMAVLVGGGLNGIGNVNSDTDLP